LTSAPDNALLSAKTSKLSKKSVANVSQLITVDTSFLTDKIHTLTNKLIAQIDGGIRLGACPRMPFRPNSSLFIKNNTRNIKYMTAFIFSKCLNFKQNVYSRTSS